MFKIWGHDDSGRSVLVFTWINDKASGLERAAYEAAHRGLGEFVNYSATRVF